MMTAGRKSSTTQFCVTKHLNTFWHQLQLISSGLLPTTVPVIVVTIHVLYTVSVLAALFHPSSHPHKSTVPFGPGIVTNLIPSLSITFATRIRLQPNRHDLRLYKDSIFLQAEHRACPKPRIQKKKRNCNSGPVSRVV